MKIFFALSLSLLLFSCDNSKTEIHQGNKEISQNDKKDDKLLDINLLTEIKLNINNKDNDYLNNFPYFIFLQNNIFYFLNVKGEIIAYDINNKAINYFMNINKIIKEQYENVGITGLYVKGDSIYIGLDCKNIVIFDNKTETIINEYSNITSCFKNFAVFSDNTIITLNGSELLEIKDTNYVKHSIDYIIPEVIIENNDTLYISDGWGSIVNIISPDLIDSVFIFKSEDEFISFIGVYKENLLWLSLKENSLIIVNKKNKEIKKYTFRRNINFDRDIPIQDSRNGIRCIVDKNIIYLLIMKDSIIKIYKTILII